MYPLSPQNPYGIPVPVSVAELVTVTVLNESVCVADVAVLVEVSVYEVEIAPIFSNSCDDEVEVAVEVTIDVFVKTSVAASVAKDVSVSDAAIDVDVASSALLVSEPALCVPEETQAK